MLESLRRTREVLPLEAMKYGLFSQALDRKIQFIDQKEYQEHFGGNDNETIAVLCGMPKIHEDQISFKEVLILINKDKFSHIPWREKKMMMQAVAVHEKIECWERMCDNDEICTLHANGRSHKIALLHEFHFAHTQGVADKYLEHLRSCARDMSPEIAQQFIAENEEAYQHVVFQHWEPALGYASKRLIDLRREV